MPSPFDRDHLRIDQFASAKPYKRPSQGPRNGIERETAQHAEDLKRELASAWAAATNLATARDGNPVGKVGSYLDFETIPYAPLPDLNWARQGIRLARADRKPDGTAHGTLFIPDASREFLIDKLEEYRDVRGARGRPSHEGRFAALEHLRAARLESLWVDRRPLPAAGEVVWWECWCWPDRRHNFLSKVEAAGVTISTQKLTFTEREVLFAYTNREMMARIVAGCDAVAELRHGRDDAAFFTSNEHRDDQQGWVAAAADRYVHVDGASDVAVCLLDTGVNRGHPLLAPLFDEKDLHSVNPAWGVDDHHGHGSEMAGLALLGDLTSILPSTTAIYHSFVGESVKLLAPGGAIPTEPSSYGLVTLQAVFRAEQAKPKRERVFCMAVTQSDVHGPRATSWSASLDMITFGGDEIDDLRPRLMCVSAGNLPDAMSKDDLEDWDTHEVEDPAQAWNILTVGGYTDKGPITDKGIEHWACAADVGALSPYSRVSAFWNRSVSAVKPELVLEAGNKGVDDAGALMSGIDSLSLLTTSSTPLARPLALSWATSAATAQLAGMAAAVMADDAELWPETVRGLLIASARWTPRMNNQILGAGNKTERLKMLRRFGYGVPSLERALRSRSSTVSLVAQAEIQPFIREKNKAPRINEAHFYQLPWPREALLSLGEKDVRVRAVLSYFVEPNPSADAPLSPARYRSAGLRFDLCRRNEPTGQFEARINALASIEEEGVEAELSEQEDAGRLLGVKSVSAGSLHVEEWRCSAADLADRNSVAVFPVGGWWKSSKDRIRNNALMRYALVITLDGGDVEQDLWIEINEQIEMSISVEIERN